MGISHENARRVILNVLAHFAAFLGWSTGLGSIVATFHWVSVAPRTPDFARGAVFEFNNHGSILYFTDHQQSVVWGGLFGGALLFFLALAVMPKRDVVRRTGFLSVGMTFKPDDPEGVRFWAGAAGFVAGLSIVGLLDPTLVSWCLAQIRTAIG